MAVTEVFFAGCRAAIRAMLAWLKGIDSMTPTLQTRGSVTPDFMLVQRQAGFH